MSGMGDGDGGLSGGARVAKTQRNKSGGNVIANPLYDDQDKEEWLGGGRGEGEDSESIKKCVPFLGARVRVRTNLAPGKPQPTSTP
jgi:hypothetical protein